MERHLGPSPERLLDSAGMVDCALLLRHRSWVAMAADRLVDDLARHDLAFEPTRHYLGSSTAEALAGASLRLQAEVSLLADDLYDGTSWPRPSLRARVEELILEEAAAVGDCASAYVD
jgi:hypothetical protein